MVTSHIYEEPRICYAEFYQRLQNPVFTSKTIAEFQTSSQYQAEQACKKDTKCSKKTSHRVVPGEKLRKAYPAFLDDQSVQCKKCSRVTFIIKIRCQDGFYFLFHVRSLPIYWVFFYFPICKTLPIIPTIYRKSKFGAK